ENTLGQMYSIFQKKRKGWQDDLKQLTGEFYTQIPHRIGRTRQAGDDAVINDLAKFQQKQETLQLMKDMLQGNGEARNGLVNPQIDSEYEALKCEVGHIDPSGSEYKEMADYVIRSQVKSKSIKVKNVYRLKRTGEWDDFKSDVGNHKMLFHGSRIQNWVGILT